MNIYRVQARRIGGIESPLTFTQGLTRTGNTVTNDVVTGKAGGNQWNGGTVSTDSLTIAANLAGGPGTIDFELGRASFDMVDISVASGAAATLDLFRITGSVVTITGATNITTAAGFNYAVLNAPSYVGSVTIGAGGTTPAAATLMINGQPTISGGGSFAGAGAVALWLRGAAASLQVDGSAVVAGAAGLRVPLVVGSTTPFGSLQLQGTSNASAGSVYTPDSFGVGRVPGLSVPPKFAVAGGVSVASGAAATLDYVVVNSSPVTITGATNITTATGFNFVSIEAPSYVSAVNIGAGGNTPAAATLAIKGPPTISGGGAFQGFGATTLWVQGNAQIDGQLTIGTGFQLRAVTGPVTIGPGGLDLQSLSATLRMGGNVGLGGGAAATLGTVGGAGPATAAQNGWLPITVAGTVSWFPFWR